eukprot:1659428-Ditylum_brightwellii.AAC.1
MTGLKMYKELLSVYQGTKYEEDNAVNAAEDVEKLKFIRNSCLTPETFFAKVNKSLKRMKVDGGKGGTTKPITDALLPTLCFKGNHDSSGKLRSAKQRSDEAGGPSNTDMKTFDKACKEGKGVHVRVWRKLSK